MASHIDIDDMPVRNHTLDPEWQGEQNRIDDALAALESEYLKDWCAGELIERGDDDIYHAPLQRLIDEHSDLFAPMLSAYSDGRQVDLIMAAEKIAKELEDYVIESAGAN